MADDKLKSAAPRALALDALRGLAILGMCLSGRVPFGELALPAWMYHAQNPPPSGALDTTVAGFTWVDLVFPAFLFSMGVAFPFALSSRLKKGVKMWRLLSGVVLRTAALGFFAIYFSHVNPWAFDMQATAERVPGFLANQWVLAFIGFLLAFPVYTRLPRQWPAWGHWATRIGGWFLLIGFLALLRYPQDGPAEIFNRSQGPIFNVYRSNIILVILTDMVLVGSLVWVFTRNNPYLRFIGFGIGMLAHAVHYYNVPGEKYFAWTPLPWMYNFAYLKYLMIVIPGTIIGDALLRWMKSPAQQRGNETSWTRGHYVAASCLIALVVIAIHVGLQTRIVYTTMVGFMGCTALLWTMFSTPRNSAEELLRTFFIWGSIWLFIGFLAEPFEGGIKKSPSTVAYYPMSLGLSIYLLLSLTVWIDILGIKRWFALLIMPGQNPMMAYLGVSTLMTPIFQIPVIESIGAAFAKTPWRAGAWAMLKTIVLAGLTSIFTKLKVYWRT